MSSLLYFSVNCGNCKDFITRLQKYPVLFNKIKLVQHGKVKFPDYIKSVPTLQLPAAGGQNKIILYSGEDLFKWLDRTVDTLAGVASAPSQQQQQQRQQRQQRGGAQSGRQQPVSTGAASAGGGGLMEYDPMAMGNGWGGCYADFDKTSNKADVTSSISRLTGFAGLGNDGTLGVVEVTSHDQQPNFDRPKGEDDMSRQISDIKSRREQDEATLKQQLSRGPGLPPPK